MNPLGIDSITRGIPAFDLDMNRVRFAIEFTEKEPGPDGCDVVRFLMSANAGEDCPDRICALIFMPAISFSQRFRRFGSMNFTGNSWRLWRKN